MKSEFEEITRQGIEVKINYNNARKFADMTFENDWYYTDDLHDAIKLVFGGKVYDSLWDTMVKLPSDCIPTEIDGEPIKLYCNLYGEHIIEIGLHKFIYNKATDYITML